MMMMKEMEEKKRRANRPEEGIINIIYIYMQYHSLFYYYSLTFKQQTATLTMCCSVHIQNSLGINKKKKNHHHPHFRSINLHTTFEWHDTNLQFQGKFEYILTENHVNKSCEQFFTEFQYNSVATHGLTVVHTAQHSTHSFRCFKWISVLGWCSAMWRERERDRQKKKRTHRKRVGSVFGEWMNEWKTKWKKK